MLEIYYVEAVQLHKLTRSMDNHGTRSVTFLLTLCSREVYLLLGGEASMPLLHLVYTDRRRWTRCVLERQGLVCSQNGSVITTRQMMAADRVTPFSAFRFTAMLPFLHRSATRHLMTS